MVEVVLVVRGRVAVRKVSSTVHGARCCVHVGPVCTVDLCARCTLYLCARWALLRPQLAAGQRWCCRHRVTTDQVSKVNRVTTYQVDKWTRISSDPSFSPNYSYRGRLEVQLRWGNIFWVDIWWFDLSSGRHERLHAERPKLASLYLYCMYLTRFRRTIRLKHIFNIWLLLAKWLHFITLSPFAFMSNRFIAQYESLHIYLMLHIFIGYIITVSIIVMKIPNPAAIIAHKCQMGRACCAHNLFNVFS